MKAVEFVKKHGIKEAIKVVGLHPVSTLINIGGSCVSVLDLKQIVDAFELVEKSGGLKACRKTLKIMDDINADKNGLLYKPFSEAVNLVERCQ